MTELTPTEQKLAGKFTRELVQLRLEMIQQNVLLWRGYIYPFTGNQVWPIDELVPPKVRIRAYTPKEKLIQHKFADFGGKCWCGAAVEKHAKQKAP